MSSWLKSACSSVALLLLAVPAFAADITVCASGCNHTTIQAAVNAAVAGDRVMIRANETFVESITLPNKGALGTPITLRSDTADANLPGVGFRAKPSLHAAFMPNLRAPSGGTPAIKTANGASDYVLLGLEFEANPEGHNTIIQIGINDSTQQFVADEPKRIVLDRLIVRGDPVFGQKLGIDLNGADLTVKNSHIDRTAAVGVDSQAVRCIQGSGPITVTNNYLESAAENFICGGDDQQMRTNAEVVSGATTTTATLTNFRAGHTIATLKNGQLVAIKTSGGTKRRHTYVRSITGNTITYDAIPEAPDTGVGSDIRWGVIPNGITFRRNHVKKPVEWMNPILSTPTGVTATPSTASGSLAAGTYCYRVQARNPNGYAGNAINSAAAAQVCATLNATGKIDLSWNAVTNATQYRVFGRASGAPTGYIQVSTTSLSDTGTALTSGSIPSSSRWQVKTLFELKVGTNVQVDSNVMEHSWTGVDLGYGVWLKSNNQGGAAPFSITKDVVFEKNLIRGVAGVFNLLGFNVDVGAANYAAQMENLTIRHNLVYDSNSAWLQGKASTWAFKTSQTIKNLVISHNTMIHQMRGFLYLTDAPVDGLVVKDNLGRAETYGVFGMTCTSGTDCLNKNTVGGVWTFDGNAIAGAPSSSYPAFTNVYPTTTDFETNHFTDYGSGVNGDYSLVAGSSFNDSATDGTDRGADIAALMTAISGVENGDPEGGGGGSPPPVNITTVGLSDGTVGVAYSQTLAATGGTTPYTWAVITGTLPGGLTLSTAGVLSGTPTTAESQTFTVEVTDSTSPTPLTDTQQLTLTINAAPTPLNITTTTLPNGSVARSYSQTLAATGGTTPYSWSVSAGTLPSGLTLTAAGVLSGVPIASGVSNFTVQVTDADSATDTQALTLTVAEEPLPCAERARRWNNAEGAFFRRTTEPATTAPDCAMVGDRWSDIGQDPPLLKVARLVGASLEWEPDSATTHTILSSTHTDVASVATATAGDIIVGTDEGKWTKLSPGGSGTILRSTGDGLTYSTDGSTLTSLNATHLFSGTVPIERLGASGTPSATTFLRGDNTWATPEGGGGGGPTGAPAVQHVTMMAGNTVTTSNVPAGGAELFASGRVRVRVDTENSTQVALLAYGVALCGGTSPKVRLEYWNGSAWAAAGAEVDCTTGLQEGTFGTLAVGARGQGKIFRAYISDGDGIADPSHSTVQINFR